VALYLSVYNAYSSLLHAGKTAPAVVATTRMFLACRFVPMKKTLDVSHLTSFAVAPDGDEVTLNMAESEGTTISLRLPFECVTQLVMTLPKIQTQAVRARHRDPTLRVVYPVGPWTMETSDDPTKVILTLITTDGFHASFALPVKEIIDMGETASRALPDISAEASRH
jgi:hypothetical protein